MDLDYLASGLLVLVILSGLAVARGPYWLDIAEPWRGRLACVLLFAPLVTGIAYQLPGFTGGF